MKKRLVALIMVIVVLVGQAQVFAADSELSPEVQRTDAGSAGRYSELSVTIPAAEWQYTFTVWSDFPIDRRTAIDNAYCFDEGGTIKVHLVGSGTSEYRADDIIVGWVLARSDGRSLQTDWRTANDVGPSYSQLSCKLPNTSDLPYGQYICRISAVGSIDGAELYHFDVQYRFTYGDTEDDDTDLTDLGDVGPMRVIQVPYTKVYNDASCSGEPIAELKRLDLVKMLDAGSASAGESGTVHIAYNLPGQELDDDGTRPYYYGYIASSAISTDSLGRFDKAQQAAEAALTRRGINGLYSQERRYMDYYTDCAALVAWAWRMADVDMTECGTSAPGLFNWAKAHPDCIVWEAEADYDAASDYLQSVKAGYGIFDYIDPFDGTGFNESRVVVYDEQMPADVLAGLQPGDVLFMNYIEDLTYTIPEPEEPAEPETTTSPDGDDAAETDDESDEDEYTGPAPGTYDMNPGNILRINQRTNNGADHVVMVTGLSYDDEGNITANVVEAANPSVNTTTAYPITLTGSRYSSIIMVIRPTDA